MAYLIWIIILVVLIVIFLIYYFFRPIEKQEIVEGEVVQKAKFQPKHHKVKGEAQIIKKGNELFLFLKDFYTVRGPDVLLVLSRDMKVKDHVNLGKLKATKGSFFVKLPANIDLEKYNKVLIWCRAFRILFSYAELKK